MEDALKCAHFLLMPAPWKIKFAESGQVLNDVKCAHQNLIWFMAIQEALSKCTQGDQSNIRRLMDIQVVLFLEDVDVVVTMTLLWKHWTVHMKLATFEQSRICAPISCQSNERISLNSSPSLMCSSTDINNKLKTFTDKKIHLEVDPSVTPHRSRACTVSHSHEATFKKKLK